MYWIWHLSGADTGNKKINVFFTTLSKRRPYFEGLNSSEIPCHLIDDVHEWCNDFFTVSDTNLVKLKVLCKCRVLTARRKDPMNLYYIHIFVITNYGVGYLRVFLISPLSILEYALVL